MRQVPRKKRRRDDARWQALHKSGRAEPESESVKSAPVKPAKPAKPAKPKT